MTPSKHIEEIQRIRIGVAVATHHAPKRHSVSAKRSGNCCCSATCFGTCSRLRVLPNLFRNLLPALPQNLPPALARGPGLKIARELAPEPAAPELAPGPAPELALELALNLLQNLSRRLLKNLLRNLLRNFLWNLLRNLFRNLLENLLRRGLLWGTCSRSAPKSLLWLKAPELCCWTLLKDILR